jgi:hypothetical protein
VPVNIEDRDPTKFEAYIDCMADAGGLDYRDPRVGRPLFTPESYTRETEAQRRQERDIEERAQRHMQDMMRRFPWVEPMWVHFMGRQRGDIRGRGYEDVVQLVGSILGILMGENETQQAKFRHDHNELLELCRRVVKAYDEGRDLEAPIEELDSMVDEIDKREN